MGGGLVSAPVRLLMVMPYPRLVRKAREEGFWVCSVWDPKVESPTQPLREVEELSDAYLVTDFEDRARLRQVVREAAERHRVEFVYHIGGEESMLPVYEVAEELGKSLNSSSSIRFLNDKLAMRQQLQSQGVSSVRFGTAATRREVPDVVADVGRPAIVKPTSLSGSKGVYLVRDDDDLRAWEGLISRYAYEGPFLVEEYLTGPEYSVETLSYWGAHHVIGITGKELSRPPLFVEMGHVHPAPLPDSRREQMEELVTTLLQTCGYRFGPAHTEVIWTDRGPRIVESQARLAGDYIPVLAELATGFDMDRAIFRMMRSIPPAPGPCRRVARIAYLRFEAGEVGSLQGVDEARRLPGVEDVRVPFAPGDRLPEIVDSRSRHGHVLLTGGSHEEAEERVRAARALIQVHRSGPDLAVVGVHAEER